MLTLTDEFNFISIPVHAATFSPWLKVCSPVGKFALRERKDWVNYRKSEVLAYSLKIDYILSADAPKPTDHKPSKLLTAAKKINPELKTVNADNLSNYKRLYKIAGARVHGR